MSKLEELEAIVQSALEKGARAAEVLQERTTKHTVVIQQPGDEPVLKRRNRDRLTVRVWVGEGRVGVKSGAPGGVERLIDQALASTFESAENRYAGPVRPLSGSSSGLGVCDRRYAQLDDATRLRAAQDVAAQLRSDPGFVAGPIAYEDVFRSRALVNHRGVRAEEDSTEYSLSVEMSGHGLHLQDGAYARTLASIVSLPIGTRLLRRGRALLQGGRVLPSGPVRLVLMPLPMSRLIAVIGECFKPDALIGSSFFLGPDDQISPALHLVDDGARPGALRTRGFDDRGVPPVPLTLLREGTVAGRFLDPVHARRYNTRPTGHQWGEQVGANNLVMRCGSRSINALLTELGGPSFQVDDFPDLRKLNLRTGAFEATVNGVVFDANVAVGAMCGVKVSGNLRDLLSNIVHVGNNTDRIGHVDAAAIIADGLFLEA